MTLPPRETNDLAHQDLMAGRYLSARARLRAGGGGGREDLWNLWTWTLNAIDPWREGWPYEAGEPQAPSATLVNTEPDGLGVHEALAAEAVAAGRLVVLMERHMLPESRWAGVRLLPILRRAGATHLAFETSSQEPLDRAQRQGVVRRDSVPYAFDPSRAALLRTAIRVGLKLVAFDHPTGPEVRAGLPPAHDPAEGDRMRERWMAENIHRLVSGEPEARVVVWTGGQHAWKRTPEYYSVPFFSSWARHPTMAAVLAEIGGKEPYCIGQAVVRWVERDDPGVLRVDDPWATEHGLDAVLVHYRGARPRRPSWVDEGRHSVTLPAGDARLVQAVPESEGPDAAPVELVMARTELVSLMLAPGRYLCRGVGDSDRLVWQRSVQV